MQRKSIKVSKLKKYQQEEKELAEEIISLVLEEQDEKKEQGDDLVQLCKKAGGLESDPEARKKVTEIAKNKFLAAKRNSALRKRDPGILENNDKFLGYVYAIIETVPVLSNMFKNLNSGVLIHFIKEHLLISPTPSSVPKNALEEINKHINEIMDTVKSSKDLINGIQQMQEALPKLLKFWNFNTNYSHPAEKIVMQEFYRKLLNQSIRKYIPREAYIESPKSMFKRHETTPDKICKINVCIEDLPNNPGRATELNKLLTNIGIKLDAPMFNNMLDDLKQTQKRKPSQ